MKKFKPIAVIASGLGGYLLLALLSSSPSWFGDSKSGKNFEETSPEVFEVSRSEGAGSDSPTAVVAEPQVDGERS